MSKGLKRICMNCGMRFYDLDKDPIVCPSCETEFTGEIKVKSRRGKVPVEASPKKEEPSKVAVATEDDDDEIDDIDADDDIVSLDDVDEDDDLDNDDDDDDTLLPIDDDDLDDIDDIDDEDDLDDDDEEDDKA